MQVLWEARVEGFVHDLWKGRVGVVGVTHLGSFWIVSTNFCYSFHHSVLFLFPRWHFQSVGLASLVVSRRMTCERVEMDKAMVWVVTETVPVLPVPWWGCRPLFLRLQSAYRCSQS